ncbi:nucleotide cyclase [Lucifera butyrica]|uniref:Nucleotide cyclase n=1 Tax=Lucifera butyrica TaxID=1351585 RepID=A0A498R685_9FIRM|nr:diguanylate cyclase [Lucifera butyrica]VBB06984.1 nucleotide cyclase [Lucifera butyrica]
MRVLIVDDEPIRRRNLTQAISEWEYDLMAVTDGNQAWSYLEKEREPVIVLLDDDGIELCRKIRQEEWKHIYVIIVTVKTKIDEIADGLDAGADDYLTRPVHDKELRSRLSAGRRILEYQYTLEKLTTELIAANKQLKHLVAVDGLTGIAGRGHFEMRLEEEWRRALRDGGPLSIIFVDIDYFKKYNETYGHLAGDDCLRRVAQILPASLYRAGDMAARYGGAEFILLLPNTDSLGAMVVAESVRVGVLDLNLEHAASPYRRVSVSLGIETVIPEQDDPAAAVVNANKALHAAKKGGRNTVRQFAH